MRRRSLDVPLLLFLPTAFGSKCSGVSVPTDTVDLLKRAIAQGGKAERQPDPTCGIRVPSRPAARRNGSVPHVCYLAFGGQLRLLQSLLAIRNLEAHSRIPPHFHILVDGKPGTYGRLCEEPAWRSLLNEGRLQLHRLDTASRRVQSLHSGLRRLAQGNGRVYLYKNLLHLLLPRHVPGPHMVHGHTVHLPLGALLSPFTMCGTGTCAASPSSTPTSTSPPT